MTDVTRAEVEAARALANEALRNGVPILWWDKRYLPYAAYIAAMNPEFALRLMDSWLALERDNEQHIQVIHSADYVLAEMEDEVERLREACRLCRDTRIR